VFSLDVQDTITERIEEMVERIGSAMNCRTDFELHKIYPATINTENEAITCRRVLEQMPTISKIHTRLAPSMASEDFSYMLEGSPGCYIWLGAGKSDGSPGLHSPHYDFNDDILSIGATYWVGLVKTLLGNGVEG
jgi:hippurate hydrolase